MKKILFAGIAVLIIVIRLVVYNLGNDYNKSSSKNEFKAINEETAWTNKINTFQQFYLTIKDFQGEHVTSYMEFLETGRWAIRTVDARDKKALDEAISYAVRQPRIAEVDSETQQIVLIIEDMIVLMDQISDYSHDADRPIYKDPRIIEYHKEMTGLQEKLDVATKTYAKNIVTATDTGNNKKLDSYVKQEKVIGYTQQEISNEIEKFFRLDVVDNNGQFLLKDMNYNEAYEQYNRISSAISKYREQINDDDLMKKEASTVINAEHYFNALLSSAEKMELKIKEIVDYVEKIQGQQLSEVEVIEAQKWEKETMEEFGTYYVQFYEIQETLKRVE